MREKRNEQNEDRVVWPKHVFKKQPTAIFFFLQVFLQLNLKRTFRTSRSHARAIVALQIITGWSTLKEALDCEPTRVWRGKKVMLLARVWNVRSGNHAHYPLVGRGFLQWFHAWNSKKKKLNRHVHAEIKNFPETWKEFASCFSKVNMNVCQNFQTMHRFCWLPDRQAIVLPTKAQLHSLIFAKEFLPQVNAIPQPHETWANVTHIWHGIYTEKNSYL